MQITIRQLSRRGSNLNIEERVFTGGALKIGRGTNQDLFLNDNRVALEHAELSLRGAGSFFIRSLSVVPLAVNGLNTDAALVGFNDHIRIGGYELRILAADAKGDDLLLEVEQVVDQDDAHAETVSKAITSLKDAGLSRRRWSWALLSIITVLFLAVPVINHFVPAAKELGQLPIVPGQDSWDSGPISNAHGHFAEDCQQCHTKPFVMTEDQACQACHDKVADHARHAEHEEFTETRCGACHKEHNGRDLILAADEFCIDCHQDLASRHPDTQLQDISGFGTGHPDFSIDVRYRNLSDATSKVQRLPLANKDTKDNSGLVFPHDRHLKKEGLLNPQGDRKIMACKDCHQLNPGEASFASIKMEKHCSDCHQLTFDPDAPDLTVPHGSVDSVLAHLRSHYFGQLLEPATDAPASTPAARSRPREPSKAVSEAHTTTHGALTAAQAEVFSVTEEVVRYRVCGTCHLVPKTDHDKPEWTIVPPIMRSTWLPMARFDHSSHLTQSCVDCHGAALESNTAEDLLIPNLDNCKQCHDDPGATSAVTSHCSDCHDFHGAALPLAHQYHQGVQHAH